MWRIFMAAIVLLSISGLWVSVQAIHELWNDPNFPMSIFGKLFVSVLILIMAVCVSFILCIWWTAL